MSRIPRFQEHLKAGFTAEAVAAARFRAFATKADDDGLPNLASHWRQLATEKDRLAIEQLQAAGQVRGAATDIGSALSSERYEVDVLYPKMRSEVDGEAGEVLDEVIDRQRGHLSRLEDLRKQFMAAKGDVDMPPEVDSGVHD